MPHTSGVGGGQTRFFKVFFCVSFSCFFLRRVFFEGPGCISHLARLQTPLWPENGYFPGKFFLVSVHRGTKPTPPGGRGACYGQAPVTQDTPLPPGVGNKKPGPKTGNWPCGVLLPAHGGAVPWLGQTRRRTRQVSCLGPRTQRRGRARARARAPHVLNLPPPGHPWGLWIWFGGSAKGGVTIGGEGYNMKIQGSLKQAISHAFWRTSVWKGGCLGRFQSGGEP